MRGNVMSLFLLSIILILISSGLAMSQERPDMGGMAQKRMQEMDTNKDGKISLEEQLADCKKRCKERFNKIDTNADGFIDAQEDQAAFKKLREMRQQHGNFKPKGSQFMPKGD